MHTVIVLEAPVNAVIDELLICVSQKYEPDIVKELRPVRVDLSLHRETIAEVFQQCR